MPFVLSIHHNILPCLMIVCCVLVLNVTAFLQSGPSSSPSLISFQSNRKRYYNNDKGMGYIDTASRTSSLNAAGDADNGVKGVKQVTGEELEKELQSWETPVVLDVYASWCGPCQLLAPELEHVAGLYKDKLRILKLDSDEEPQVASMLKVYGLPTVLFMKEGKVVYRAEGALPAAEVSRLINLHLFGNAEEDKKE